LPAAVILLALESAMSAGSVAVCDGAGQVLAQRRSPPEAGQADRLIELIDAALDTAGVDYPDLDVIAVNHGPGSFTGVRAGVAAARGLALALGRPVIAVNTLEALAAAAGVQPAGTVVAAVDARRGQVYVQTFDHRLGRRSSASAPRRTRWPWRSARLPDCARVSARVRGGRCSRCICGRPMPASQRLRRHAPARQLAPEHARAQA
jgi:tRNA threonylcarbamoyl adenosine modification protein YeaZ